VADMLRLARSRVDVTLTQLMLVDSLEVTDADRRRIVESCRTCAEDRIVVTHGTDTMVETAAALARGADGKTILLTGAIMVQYAFGSSDGFSISRARCRAYRRLLRACTWR
jgi:L-asparaginase